MPDVSWSTLALIGLGCLTLGGLVTGVVQHMDADRGVVGACGALAASVFSYLQSSVIRNNPVTRTWDNLGYLKDTFDSVFAAKPTQADELDKLVKAEYYKWLADYHKEHYDNEPTKLQSDLKLQSLKEKYSGLSRPQASSLYVKEWVNSLMDHKTGKDEVLNDVAKLVYNGTIRDSMTERQINQELMNNKLPNMETINSRLSWKSWLKSWVYGTRMGDDDASSVASDHSSIAIGESPDANPPEYTPLQERMRHYATIDPHFGKYSIAKVGEIIDCFDTIPADFARSKDDIDRLFWDRFPNYRDMVNRQSMVDTVYRFFDYDKGSYSPAPTPAATPLSTPPKSPGTETRKTSGITIPQDLPGSATDWAKVATLPPTPSYLPPVDVEEELKRSVSHLATDPTLPRGGTPAPDTTQSSVNVETSESTRTSAPPHWVNSLLESDLFDNEDKKVMYQYVSCIVM